MIASLLALSLLAQDSPFLRCADLASDEARLACYDRTAAMVRANAAAPALSPRVPTQNESAAPAPGTAPSAVLPPARAAVAAPEEARRRFGLRRRVETEEPESITSAVAELALSRAGRAVLTLEDGSVWRQLDGDDRTVRLRREMPSQTVTIKRGALGSYRATIEPLGRTIRVRRVQ